MQENIFYIRDSEINLHNIHAEITSAVNTHKNNKYQNYDLSKVSRYLLASIKDQKQYINENIKIINKSWAIDINDFEILIKKEGILSLLEFLFKKVIWKLLKFYTYRLFSQQREFNMQMKDAVTLLYSDYQKRLNIIETSIKKLQLDSKDE